MQNLFISPEDEFVIKLSVAIDKDSTIFCDIERKTLVEALEAMGRDVSDFEIADYTVTFKKPSFGDTMELYGSIFNLNESEGVSFNPVMARYNKIIALIKLWDLQGEVKKPTSEEVMSLHPVIANAIGIQVDLETGGILS